MQESQHFDEKPMSVFSRREVISVLAQGVASYSFFSLLFSTNAFGRPVREHTDHWVKQLNDMSRDLKRGGISQIQWQEQLAELYNYISPEELMEFVDFDRLVKDFTLPDRGVNTRPVRFPRLVGLPNTLVFGKKLFGMKKDRAIIPHGHNNMVSCHFVLQGEVHVRHYNKISEDDTSMVIEPTVDLIGKPGSFSSISDQHNNVHWIRALTPTAFTFDVIVTDLNGDDWDVQNIDPYTAQPNGQGQLRAEKLGVEEALRKYGHDSHH